jgi:hypothetical protein
MNLKKRILAGTGLAVPLLIPALAGAVPGVPVPASGPAPLAESQLDGVTAGLIVCITTPCEEPAPYPLPTGWKPPIRPPITWWKPGPPPFVTQTQCGENGMLCPTVLPGL